MVEKGRVNSMKFEYNFFTPAVGDLVVDGHDGVHGIVVGAGPWHTWAYFVDQGAVRLLILQVQLPEYNNIIEQYSLKCVEKNGIDIIISPLRFESNKDANLLKTIF